MDNFSTQFVFKKQVTLRLILTLVLLLATLSVPAAGASLTLWGKQTQGWGMKNAETTGNRLTIEKPATITRVKGGEKGFCIWQAVTTQNRTARSVLCGGGNEPSIIGRVLPPGTYTILPEAGTSVTIYLKYQRSTQQNPQSGFYASFAGDWESNWGKMHFTQNGNIVRGTYTHDNGQISGTVQGRKMTGTWTEVPSRTPPNDAGDIEFILSKNGKKLTGKWRYGSNKKGWDGAWEARRISKTAYGSNQTGSGTAIAGKQPQSRGLADISGTWRWFDGGTVWIYKNGAIRSSHGSPATWTVMQKGFGKYIYTINWNNGQYIDTLTLKGNTLDGHNQNGTHVWGKRISNSAGFSNRLVSGTYRVTQGHWASTWRLNVSNGQINGTSEWTCCPHYRIDPLRGNISGNTVVIQRDCSGQGWNGACKQIYRGQIKGDRIEGTCSGTGLTAGDTWVLYLSGGIGTQNQTPQNISGTPTEGQQQQNQGGESSSGQSPGSAGSNVTIYNGIKFPLGIKSFADRVVSFKPGRGTGERDGSAAVGPPDAGKGTGPSVIGAKGDVSLGRGGSIIVQFTDNYLVDVKGLDLYVFEFGPDVEAFKVEISKDGVNWIDLGTVRGQPTGLDIHNKVAPGDRFSYVRITDANPYAPRDAKSIGKPQYEGADIDAVGAIGAEEKHASVTNGGFKGTPGSTPTSEGTAGIKQTNGKPAGSGNTSGAGGNTGQANNTVNQPTSNTSTSSATSKGKTLTLWGKQTQGWGMENAETTGNRLTLEKPAKIIHVKGGGKGFCIWLAVKPTNHTAHSVMCGGENSPTIIGRVLPPGTYTVLPEAGTSVTIELRYTRGTGNGVGIGPVSGATHPPTHKEGNKAGEQISEYHVVIRSQKNPSATSLILKVGEKRRFIAWLEDDAGNKRSVTVKEWKVSNKKVGSINRDGVFKSKSNGVTSVYATVEGQGSKKISGFVTVTVSDLKPVIIQGSVDFEDENGKHINWPLGNHKIFCTYKNKNNRLYVTQSTDIMGRFKFVLPFWTKRTNAMIKVVGLTSAPSGYVWRTHAVCLNRSCGNWKYSNSWELSPGTKVAFFMSIVLRKLAVNIEGRVMHHGKPVYDADVKLIDSAGNVVEEDWSDYDGDYSIGVDTLPRGTYILKAEYKSKKHVTLHNWLVMKKNIKIELPLKKTHTNIDGDEISIINIELISQADKMGYTGP